MADMLRNYDLQMRPITTEAPWQIRRNDRSHRFIRRAMNKVNFDNEYDSGNNFEKLT